MNSVTFVRSETCAKQARTFRKSQVKLLWRGAQGTRSVLIPPQREQFTRRSAYSSQTRSRPSPR